MDKNSKFYNKLKKITQGFLKVLVQVFVSFIPVKKLRKKIRRKLFYKIFGEPEPTCVVLDINSKWLETYISEVIQNEYDLSDALKAEKIVVFFEIEYNRICGGQFAYFSYCMNSKLILGKEYAVLMSTLPGSFTYSHLQYFNNNIEICRFEQILDIIKNKREVIIMLPEADVVSPADGSELFRNRLSPQDIKILKSIPKLRINILNGRIDYQPHKNAINWLRTLTKNVTTSVGNFSACSQEICNFIGMPLYLIPAKIDISMYKKVEFSKKRKLIILSYDLYGCDLLFKIDFIRKLNRELPDYQVCVLYGKTFDEFQRLMAVSMAVISFGEGFDGYFFNSNYLGTAGFAVYNDVFFPDKRWKDYDNVYSSYQELYENFVTDFKKITKDKEIYYHFTKPIHDECDKLYNMTAYLNSLRKFYEETPDYVPTKK